eukprot:3534446-Rhodomonas_salina.1
MSGTSMHFAYAMPGTAVAYAVLPIYALSDTDRAYAALRAGLLRRHWREKPQRDRTEPASNGPLFTSVNLTSGAAANKKVAARAIAFVYGLDC